MSNLGEMRTNVLLRMAETSGGTFTDVEVNRMIQREYEFVQTKINMKNDEYFAKQQITNTVAANSYAFPSDFVKVLQIELLDSTNRWMEVAKTSLHQKNLIEDQRAFIYNQWPYRYYIIGSLYYFAPAVPDGTNNLKLIYIYAPTKLTADADTPVFPEQYHEVLEIGAINRLRKAVKEPSIDQDQYDQQILNLIETISPRVKGHPTQVRMIPGIY